jgi:hypothetical protein
MGLATVKPGANIWALLASGLLLVGSCAIAHFKANDVERKIESLQTSLRLMTSEAGDVLLVQEIFPADHVADLNGITVDDLKEEAGIFSDALANIIRRFPKNRNVGARIGALAKETMRLFPFRRR